MRKELHSRGLKPLNHETRSAIRLPVLIKALVGVVWVEAVLSLCGKHGDATGDLVIQTWRGSTTALTTVACRSRPGSGCGARAKAQGAIAWDTLVVCAGGGFIGDTDSGETALLASPALGWVLEGLHGHCVRG